MDPGSGQLKGFMKRFKEGKPIKSLIKCFESSSYKIAKVRAKYQKFILGQK